MRSKSTLFIALLVCKLGLVTTDSVKPSEDVVPKLFPKDVLVRLCEDFRPNQAPTVKALTRKPVAKPYTPSLDSSMISERLDTFISELIDFVPTTGFEIDRFKNATSNLEHILSDIESDVSREVFHEIFVFERLKNCRMLFVSMKIAATKMIDYDATGRFNERCIYEIIELHVMALVLESSFNLVDFTATEREAKIYSLHCKFVNATNKYRRLGLLKSEFNDAEFWHQAKQTDHTISGLRQYMNNGEEWGDCSP